MQSSGVKIGIKIAGNYGTCSFLQDYRKRGYASFMLTAREIAEENVSEETFKPQVRRKKILI